MIFSIPVVQDQFGIGKYDEWSWPNVKFEATKLRGFHKDYAQTSGIFKAPNGGNGRSSCR